MDTLPIGPRLLLSVQGLHRRPRLPADSVIVQTGERLRLLEQPQSSANWLLWEVTLLAEPLGVVHWQQWRGLVLRVDEDEGSEDFGQPLTSE